MIIKIGSSQFNADALRDLTLEEAVKNHPHLSKEMVKEAWKKAQAKVKKSSK